MNRPAGCFAFALLWLLVVRVLAFERENDQRQSGTARGNCCCCVNVITQYTINAHAERVCVL
ncbi:hypothetical protein BC832DRAFT_557303 [Gaertneriomyces semiglobifer]|nr:hypothetical protein BC832DRAFT_557303 [Gaertneriomyces semiglobifer]